MTIVFGCVEDREAEKKREAGELVACDCKKAMKAMAFGPSQACSPIGHPRRPWFTRLEGDLGFKMKHCWGGD